MAAIEDLVTLSEDSDILERPSGLFETSLIQSTPVTTSSILNNS